MRDSERAVKISISTQVRACIEASLPPSCSVRKAYVIGLAPGDALARAVDALAREPAERSTFPRTHEACGGPP